MVAGSGQIMKVARMKITEVFDDYSAPDDVDSICQEVARFLQFSRTTQAMGKYFARSDLLRRKPEPSLHIGGITPRNFCTNFDYAGRLSFLAW